MSLGCARDRKAGRSCPVARLAASTRGDLAKRARFIVPLPVPRKCLKTRRESTKPLAAGVSCPNLTLFGPSQKVDHTKPLLVADSAGPPQQAAATTTERRPGRLEAPAY